MPIAEIDNKIFFETYNHHWQISPSLHFSCDMTTSLASME